MTQADGKPPGMLQQLNDLLQSMAEALNEGANVQRSPRPVAGKPASAGQPVRGPQQQTQPQAQRQAQQASGVASRARPAADGSRRQVGESAEMKEERERQMRANNAREERVQQQKRAEFERQQKIVQDSDRARHEKQQVQARGAPVQKGGAKAVNKASGSRYGRFLLGSNKNIRDAIVLAEIIGPCRAEKGWRDM